MESTSVLLFPVLEADAKVSRYRARLDPTERQGMPAHVTLVVPFMPPGLIDDSVIAALSRLFCRFPAFEFTLSRVGWFDRRVVYLAPTGVESFRELVHAVVHDFPDYPPYEGAFAEVIPHVTIGESGRWRKRTRAMQRAALEVERLLPIHCQASEVWLMVHQASSGRWERLQTFQLAESSVRYGVGTA